jgi:hypothetical protein
VALQDQWCHTILLTLTEKSRKIQRGGTARSVVSYYSTKTNTKVPQDSAGWHCNSQWCHTTLLTLKQKSRKIQRGGTPTVGVSNYSTNTNTKVPQDSAGWHCNIQWCHTTLLTLTKSPARFSGVAQPQSVCQTITTTNMKASTGKRWGHYHSRCVQLLP